MANELIKERHSSYTLRAPLTLESTEEVRGNGPFATACRYSSTVASCKDFPLPIYAAKAIFPEPEKEINTAIVQEQQQKQKTSFLKRLSLANLKVQMSNFYIKVKDTLASWKNKTAEASSKADKKVGNSVKTGKINTAAKTKSNAVDKVEMTPSAPVQTFTTDDLEMQRIKDIEETMSEYQIELQKSDGGDIKKMIEMVGKILILANTLGYRYNKKEIKDYMDHLEVNITKRVKTFERNWAIIGSSIAIQGVSAVFSFAGLGSGLAGGTMGKVLSGLSGTSSSLSYFGQTITKIDEAKEAEKTGLRTELEHGGEKLKTFNQQMDRTNDKIHQAIQDMLNARRSLDQTDTESKKRAAAAA